MYFVALGGYRSIAGPLVICFLDIKGITNKDFFLGMAKDHKRMHEWAAVKKEVVAAHSREEFTYSYKVIEASEFDYMTTYEAVNSGYLRAVLTLDLPLEPINCYTIQRGIPKAPFYNIEKVSRDSAEGMLSSAVAFLAYKEEMLRLHNTYPQYHWDKNSGMVNDAHMEAILSYGPCEHHRSKAIKNIPNWIANKANRAKTQDEIERYRNCFVFTKQWWGKYVHYGTAMVDKLDKEGLKNLHQSYNKTDTDTWLVCDDDFFDWCVDCAPSAEDAEWLINLKSKELKRWKHFMKESLANTQDVAAMHLHKKYLPPVI